MSTASAVAPLPGDSNAGPPPRIQRLRVQNYRALRDLTRKDLTPLTVLSGPNSPTFVDALRPDDLWVRHRAADGYARASRRAFNGEPDLLRKLPERLSGYADGAFGTKVGICVVVDQDREDCLTLKERMGEEAHRAGLARESAPDDDRAFMVVNRVAVEDLEAWFPVDPDAANQADPVVPASFATRAAYCDPDHVRGGTAEARERPLQRAGYHRGGLRKLQAAQEIAPFVRPSDNSSVSFRSFCSGVSALLGALDEPEP